ncbi:hypothetical protein D3C87_2083530 [compost metagenome]
MIDQRYLEIGIDRDLAAVDFHLSLNRPLFRNAVNREFPGRRHVVIAVFGIIRRLIDLA